MATMCEDGDFILTPEELNYLSILDERDALAMFAQQDEDGAHAFVDVLEDGNLLHAFIEDGNLLIDGDSSVMKRGKELDLVNASLGPTLGVFDVDHLFDEDLFEEDLPKLWPQTELEGSSDENKLECVFDVPMFTSEGLLAHGQVRMEETEASCCLGEFGRLLAEEKAPSLDGLLDEGLLSHGQARMEETEACCLDEFGGLLAEEKAPSLDGLLARDSEAHILDNDANLVNFCLPIQEKKDEWVNASGNTIVLGNDMPCTYQSGWQPWGQQATQEMAANSWTLPPLSASPWEQQHAITSMAPVSTFPWQQQAWLLLPPVSTSTWEQQAPQQMAAPSMKKRKAEHKKTIPNQKIDKAAMPHLVCSRCFSDNTRFDYNNNYSLNQPRYKCTSCDRHWTVGGKIRKSGGRRHKKAKRKSANIEDID